MKMIIVAVRDSAIDAFMRPFFVPSVAAAVRSFGDEVNRSGSEMAAHPEDYELFELGNWFDADASFEVLPKPRSVSRAVDFVSVNMKSSVKLVS